MNRERVITRLALLGLIVAIFFIAKRSLLDRFFGTEPIRIDDEPGDVRELASILNPPRLQPRTSGCDRIGGLHERLSDQSP